MAPSAWMVGCSKEGPGLQMLLNVPEEAVEPLSSGWAAYVSERGPVSM